MQKQQNNNKPVTQLSQLSQKHPATKYTVAFKDWEIPLCLICGTGDIFSWTLKEPINIAHILCIYKKRNSFYKFCLQDKTLEVIF